MNRARRMVQVAVAMALLSGMSAASARGASPYLPLQLSPEVERDIERALVLADQPIMTRPIAAATVLDALPATCKIDEALCKRVRSHLQRYMQSMGIDHASAEVAASDGDVPLPNQHGMENDSAWAVSARAHWQPLDSLIISLGGIAYDGEAAPTGSMVSFGWDWAQVDVGFRDHWLSPFQQSAMMISTQAPTLPSVTMSNYRSFTRFNLRYQIFLAEMEYTDQIVFQDRFTSGNPRLAGLHLSIEPATGWSLAAGRMLQFGGGERGGTGFGDFFNALFRPDQYDNFNADQDRDAEFGNQVAALSSSFVFPGSVPFKAYLEYAGEDRSYEGNFRLGNSALSVGLHFPVLWQYFDLTYEMSEWQNAWYVAGLYGDGLTDDGHVLGHWGADQRVFGDAVGAQTHMLQLGWTPGFGGLLQLRARTIDNESYGAFDYQLGYDVAVTYSRNLRGLTVGAQAMMGRDVFGDSYSRLAGFVRLGADWSGNSRGWSGAAPRHSGAELFVDAGLGVGWTTVRVGDGTPKYDTDTEIAPHMGVGARRRVSDRSDLGVRAEFDRIDGELFFAVRAIDYRYRFRNPLAFNFFLGAARYDLATPAYGYYLGVGGQWRDILPRFDLNMDLRYGDKVARDKLLPTDAGSSLRPDSFYDITGATLSLSYKF